MSSIGPRHDRVFMARTARMPVENRLPGVPKQNGPTPAVREFYLGQRRMQLAHPLLKLRKNSHRLRIGDIDGVKIVRSRENEPIPRPR